MNAALRSLRTYFTRIGAALPPAFSSKHGQLNIKQASATEDEAYLVLRDSSGDFQYRRVLTETYADTLYADIASEHDAVTVSDSTSIDLTLTGQQISAAAKFGTASGTIAQGDHTHAATFAVPQPGYFPIGCHWSAADETTLSSGAVSASYMGVAAEAYATISLRFEVTTAAVTVTWAEVGIGTGTIDGLGGDVDMTRRGYTDVSGVVNSLGVKTVDVTVSGIAAGDHLWALFGSDAGTEAQFGEAELESLVAGVIQSGNGRISTMDTPEAFLSNIGSNGVFGFWLGSA